MGMSTYSMNFANWAVCRETWKRIRQKQPVLGSKQGRKRLLGPLKETPKSPQDC